MVLIGVFGEGFEIVSKVFFKEWYKKREHGIEITGSVFWMVVVIGLAWEIPEASENDRKAGEANERAAKFRKEAEELRRDNLKVYAQIQPRRIDADTRAKLIATLGTNAKPGVVEVKWSIGDSEAGFFALQIVDLLTFTGFDVNSEPVITTGMLVFGLAMQVKNPSNCPERARAIFEAFNTNDIGMIVGPLPPNRPDDNIVRIIVGSKPLPPNDISDFKFPSKVQPVKPGPISN